MQMISNEIKRKSYLKLFAAGTTVLLIILLYFFVDARYTSLFPHCPFHYLTGLYCPGCGSQRAISSLLHGDVLQAMNFNLMLVISLPLLLYSAYVKIHNTVSKKVLQQKFFYSPVFVKVTLILVILFWIARNIQSQPFSLLAPHQLAIH